LFIRNKKEKYIIFWHACSEKKIDILVNADSNCYDLFVWIILFFISKPASKKCVWISFLRATKTKTFSNKQKINKLKQEEEEEKDK